MAWKGCGGMEFRILKQVLFCVPKQVLFCLLGVSLSVCVLCPVDVLANGQEEYPLSYEMPSDARYGIGGINTSGGEKSYMILEEAGPDYTVLPGDSLWSISEKLWGDGHNYSSLAACNLDVLSNPDLIYPGIRLKTARTAYLRWDKRSRGGVQMGEYSMDMPYDWTVGYMQSGQAWANFAMQGDGVIGCLVQDRQKDVGKTVSDWEKCREQITKYVNEKYSEQVSDLHFAHYKMENQGDGAGEIYLYSFTWQISPEYPSLVYRVCMGMKLTEHIQAEFLGFAPEDNYDIEGCVRYVTATFEEYFDENSSEKFTVNDSNMRMEPSNTWELSGMFNAFYFVDEYFTSKLEKAIKAVSGSEEDKGKYGGRIEN